MSGVTFKRPQGGGDGKSHFTHPAGAYGAICRDWYVVRKKHQFAGQKNKFGKINPELDEKLVIEFLTTEMVGDGEDARPAFSSFRAKPSMHEKSAMYAFLTEWRSDMDPTEIEAIFYGEREGKTLDDLILGRPCLVNIKHRKDTNDASKVWADVSTAMQLPTGMKHPEIPTDFVRKPGGLVDLTQEGTTADAAGAQSIRDGEEEPEQAPF